MLTLLGRTIFVLDVVKANILGIVGVGITNLDVVYPKSPNDAVAFSIQVQN